MVSSSEAAWMRDKRAYEILRPRIEVTGKCRFWGRDYEVTPCLVPGKIGDGRVLLGLETLADRPNYYAVRIPEHWWPSDNAGFDTEPGDARGRGRDRTDVILDLIESAFMTSDGPDEDDEPGELPRPWPALNMSCGCGWWRIGHVYDLFAPSTDNKEVSP